MFLRDYTLCNLIFWFLTVRASHRLTFMYLANDVIQNSKKKGPEFTKDFATVLPDAYKFATK